MIKNKKMIKFLNKIINSGDKVMQKVNKALEKKKH